MGLELSVDAVMRSCVLGRRFFRWFLMSGCVLQFVSNPTVPSNFFVIDISFCWLFSFPASWEADAETEVLKPAGTQGKAPLPHLMRRVESYTGWHIYGEPALMRWGTEEADEDGVLETLNRLRFWLCLGGGSIRCVVTSVERSERLFLECTSNQNHKTVRYTGGMGHGPDS